MDGASSPRIGGISLEQYAGVTQALAERLALDEVLAQERIPADVWRSAELAWREALVDAPDLQLELISVRRRAEDCLARPVSPLDDDPEAWMGLMGVLALADGAKGAVEALGLTMCDVARLARSWKRRMEQDPALSDRLIELAPRARPPSSVRVAPMQLRRFPWSPAEEPRPSADAEQTVAAPPAEATSPAPAPRLASFQLVAPAADPPAPPIAVAAPPSPITPAVGAVTEWLPPDATPQAATPFSELDPEAHGVPLSRYAEIVAALQEANADSPQILSDRGLTDVQWRALSAHYEQKFRRQARWSMEFGRLLGAAQKALRERREEAQKPLPRTTRHMSQSEARPTAALEVTPSLPELTVDQYAWIVASIRGAAAADVPAVLARFRLTPESHRALESSWREKMRADAAIADAFARRLRALVAPPAPAAASVAAAPVQRGADSPSGPQQRTAFISERPASDRSAPLPFTPGEARIQLPAARAPEVTRDGFTEPPRSSAGKGAATPFGKSASAGRMPLDRYAEVSAALEREGDPTATFKRLGIDPAAFVSTAHAYSAIFADDPSLEVEYKRLLADAAEKLRQRSR